ncbi:hypothetical protein [uncultured Rikenella sp.]|uniref:hypothetical protein n=1 Tax=uncultured Rikenella sp. TaxID=368003 RepID=UPI00261ED46B|nr:hypothetical protein [uncultured Rikenella sp.]
MFNAKRQAVAALSFLCAAAVSSVRAQEIVAPAGGTWRWEIGADGTAQRLIFAGDGSRETDTIPFIIREKYRGPSFYLKDPANGVDTTAAWNLAGPGLYRSVPIEGIVCTLQYRADTENPTLRVTLKNEGRAPVQPEKAGLRLGLDAYMDRWPDWFGQYFPTLLRCEKTHFWGYFQAPGAGRPLLGIASPQPVASWSTDFSLGYRDPAPHWFWGHRIESVNLDLLNAQPLPERHPQNLWQLKPGEARTWDIVLFPVAEPDDLELKVCDIAQAPTLSFEKTSYRPDEKVQIELYSPSASERPKVTVRRSSDGKEIAVYARYMGRGQFVSDPFYLPQPGLYTVRATVGDRCAEGILSALHPWSWYMQRGREAALRHRQKASSHVESWMGFYTAFLTAREFPDDSLDAALTERFELLFGLLHDTVKMEPRYFRSRIQNTAGTIGILSDKYEAYGDILDLERAARLADWLTRTSQREDGAYCNRGTIYTSVIYIAKSVLELAEIERRLAASSPDSVRWRERYERHYASAARAVDQLVAARGNFQTEGEHTFEDGMISCSALQMGLMALWQSDTAERARYTQAMLEVLDSHDCLAQLRVPDARRRGGTMRFWEAQYDVQMLPNMFNSPHGWSAWRGYATYYAYLLTGEERWLRETFNAMGAFANLVDPETGDLSWAFISDPYVAAEQVCGPDTTVTFETPTFGNPHPRLYPTRRFVIGEQYVPMVSGWQPVNTQDNDVHEVFKLIAEAALNHAFVIVRADGTAAGYNCEVMRRGKKNLIVVPSEPQIRAVHFNVPEPMEATVEFSSGTVERQVGPMQWLEESL